MRKIPPAELILNDDGSIYHLNLLPEDVADTIILVGDPDRVPKVSKHFDRIELKKQKRELVTHTGFIGKKRMTVISTGMSTDNIDIVLTELDALVNIDLKERVVKPALKSLNFVRIGTAACLQQDIAIDSFIVSSHGLGLDGLANFYEIAYTSDEKDINKTFQQYFHDESAVQNCYTVKGAMSLVNLFKKEMRAGITITAAGFYAPQGRMLRMTPKIAHFVERLQGFHWHHEMATNFEMETAGIYAMGRILGHACCSLSAIVANRISGEFSTQANQTVDRLIQLTLEKLSVEQTAEIA